MQIRAVSLIVAVSLGFAIAPNPAAAACPALPYSAISGGSVSDANQLMADFNAVAACQNSGPSGSPDAVQYNNSGGLAGVGPLTNGQTIIGSTGAAPQASTLTAGPGITITNSSASVMISAVNAGANYLRELGPYAPPTASSFTFLDSPTTDVVPSVTNIANVGLQYQAATTWYVGLNAGAYRLVPSLSSWTLTMRAKPSALSYGTDNGGSSFGIWIQDSAGQIVGFQIVQGHNLGHAHARSHEDVPVFVDGMFPVRETPTWFRVQLSAAKLLFFVSWDGQNWIGVYSEPISGFLNGTLKYVGIGGDTTFGQGTNPSTIGPAGALVTYWDIDDDPASVRQIQ